MMYECKLKCSLNLISSLIESLGSLLNKVGNLPHFDLDFITMIKHSTLLFLIFSQKETMLRLPIYSKLCV